MNKYKKLRIRSKSKNFKEKMKKQKSQKILKYKQLKIQKSLRLMLLNKKINHCKEEIDIKK